MGVDIDHEDALLKSIWDREGWRPNALVENPANGHAHAVWPLIEPITRTEYARRKPLSFAAAVTEGLRRYVHGDKNYSGLMTKNSDHDHSNASWWSNELYHAGNPATVPYSVAKPRPYYNNFKRK